MDEKKIKDKEAARRRQSDLRNAWISEKLDRLNLSMPKGKKDKIKAHAASMSESTNAFINRAIDEQMKRDSGE